MQKKIAGLLKGHIIMSNSRSKRLSHIVSAYPSSCHDEAVRDIESIT